MCSPLGGGAPAPARGWLRNYWCPQGLMPPPFYQHHRSLERRGGPSTPCSGDARLGDAAWGSQVFFQPGGGGFILMVCWVVLFSQHVPLGKGSRVGGGGICAPWLGGSRWVMLSPAAARSRGRAELACELQGCHAAAPAARPGLWFYTIPGGLLEPAKHPGECCPGRVPPDPGGDATRPRGSAKNWLFFSLQEGQKSYLGEAQATFSIGNNPLQK